MFTCHGLYITCHTPYTMYHMFYLVCYIWCPRFEVLNRHQPTGALLPSPGRIKRMKLEAKEATTMAFGGPERKIGLVPFIGVSFLWVSLNMRFLLVEVLSLNWVLGHPFWGFLSGT